MATRRKLLWLQKLSSCIVASTKFFVETTFTCVLTCRRNSCHNHALLATVLWLLQPQCLYLFSFELLPFLRRIVATTTRSWLQCCGSHNHSVVAIPTTVFVPLPVVIGAFTFTRSFALSVRHRVTWSYAMDDMSPWPLQPCTRACILCTVEVSNANENFGFVSYLILKWVKKKPSWNQ